MTYKISPNSPPPIASIMGFTPIRPMRAQRLLSASGGIKELRERKANTPFIKKSKIIEISQSVLAEINSYRNKLKRGIPKTDLHRTTREIKFLVANLSFAITDINEKIEDLHREREYRKIDVDYLSQEVVLSLINNDGSLCNALTDPRIQHSSSCIETKISKVKSESTILSSALQSLCQYHKILQAYADAQQSGHILGDVIHIPSHLQKINDRIYFLGEKFTLLHEIGEGAWALVNQCKLGDKSYAVKIAKVSATVFRSMSDPDMIIDYDNVYKRDVFVPLLLNHPNIIKLCGIHFDRAILEFIPSGNLTHWHKKKERFTEQQTLNILIQIASALQHMHDLNIIHRDLKPDNILIDASSSELRAVLIDFGTACSVDSKKRMTLAGTPMYMSPEVLRITVSNKPKSKAIFKQDFMGKEGDIWSFGLILYQILTGGRDLYSERCIGKSTRTKYNFKPSAGYSTLTYRDNKQFSYEYLFQSFLISRRKSSKAMRDTSLASELLTLCSECLEKRVENRPSIERVLSSLQRAQERKSSVSN